VSQPYDRNSRIPAPGRLDPTLKEFWVENPFDIARQRHNLSAFERKRTFLNVRGRDFLDISYLTGADGEGDGRCIVAGDLRNNGRLDLVLRQAGGGPVVVYENDFPQNHYLEVSLRGTKSNRHGIGARLVATVMGQPLVRELFPQNTFHSQMPATVHFGLGAADRVDRLVIRWPSGQEQVLTELAADRHIVVEEGREGEEAIETVRPGRTIRP
jgi:hypothetical protein